LFKRVHINGNWKYRHEEYGGIIPPPQACGGGGGGLKKKKNKKKKKFKIKILIKKKINF
jgi:hypothetical protein